MSELLNKRKPLDIHGRFQHITPEFAGWKHVGFEVYTLEAAQSLSFSAAPDEEICLVLVGGRANFTLNGNALGELGDRDGPFDRKKPYSVYVTAGDSVSLIATSMLELAVCRAPGKGTYPSRVIGPESVGAEARGAGNNKRYVHNILPDTAEADSLLVVEVYTDEGCTSSYPSHKHDRNAPPHETQLEETYYHRLNPAQGFCIQRVYTDDRELDECMAVYDGDVVMVPKGYHPVATIAGYDSYYLNVMAGPVRQWLFTWESDHEWVNSPVYAQKHPV
ncbi:5-deoxy-glucuronate isomerase [Enterovibrio nigricans]|uniref:5-deoxy-glucuronate isomerase n=1 Tax=Enterovibrio nigricans DSM 22720 TaxID=1121868 RepID=A0A1T4UUJ9_9GAMM|nr:5-deoxy-glucuronate isomerase [Enterovibrio nigricans]PKF50006.1 5-deoxy-glucuronate isomerase [Enterovibrio nigricans]SKA56373.1 5-deoxy-glucuronate isomerase [Enterovibrio nigricans DSM 22720]